MKLPELLDVWGSRSPSELIQNIARIATTGTRSTMKLLKPAVLTEEVPRGFASSTDPAICYLVWSDGKTFSYTLRCTCGLVKTIAPDDDGWCYYEHLVPACGWRVNLVLEGFQSGRWAKAKKEEVKGN